MATYIIIDRIFSIITILAICGFTIEMYVESMEARSGRKFLKYCLASFVGIITVFYNLGRTVILWLY